jgi:hypothetical protein
MTKVQLKILVRQPGSMKQHEVVLEADITNHSLPEDKIAGLMFNIEYVLNEHIPAIRVHSAINITE